MPAITIGTSRGGASFSHRVPFATAEAAEEAYHDLLRHFAECCKIGNEYDTAEVEGDGAWLAFRVRELRTVFLER